MKNERELVKNTIPIYEKDGSIKEFEATVTGCYTIPADAENHPSMLDGNSATIYGIELDQTAFFPEGGGQPGDEGWLEISASNGDRPPYSTGDRPPCDSDANGDRPSCNALSITVYDTKTDEEGRILHYVDTPLEAGTKVTGKLNWPLRLSRMQNHGAEHLLCGIIHNRFGYENNGFHMNNDGVIFDVDGPLTENEIREIEKTANDLIYKNLPITISFPTPEEAEKLEYRSKLDSFENIRLVTIQDTDVCACCAPQLSFTSQIGVVKIIDFMPHRQGMRMTMVAGHDAYDDYVNLHDANGKIMALLSSKRDTTAEFAQSFMDRLNAARDENTSLKKAMIELVSKSEIERILNRRNTENNQPVSDTCNCTNTDTITFESETIDIVFCGLNDTTGLRNLVNKCIKECGGIIAGFCPSENGYSYIIGKSDECDANILPKLAKTLNEITGGRGGGSPKMVQGSFPFCDLKTVCKQLQM